MTVQTAILGNGSARPAASTIWKGSVRRRPSNSGTPGSNRAIGNTNAAARTADGRIKGQVTPYQARSRPAPASRAASSQAGCTRSRAVAVASATRATALGRVVQSQNIQSGRPLHVSRLTLSVPTSLEDQGHGHGRGDPNKPRSPIAMQAGGAASIAAMAVRSTPRPQNRRRAIIQPSPTPPISESAVSDVA